MARGGPDTPGIIVHLFILFGLIVAVSEFFNQSSLTPIKF
jgi:hypothetical protein